MHLFKNTNYAALLLASVIFAGCNKESRTPSPITTANKAATIITDAAASNMVLTPAGLMDKSKVHYIQPGTELRVSNGHLQQIQSASGKMLQDFGVVSLVPDAIHGSANKFVPAQVNGWAAYTYWQNPDKSKPIVYYTTSWTVPALPKTQGNQTLFIFNGMQDGVTQTSYIVQPVLQWGGSAAGGGKYWAVTNWYVSASQAFFGKLQTVAVGTKLTGVMTETGFTGKNFNYTSAFTGYPDSVNLKVSNVPQANWAAETLEVYGVSAAGQYPAQTSMAFSAIQMLRLDSTAVMQNKSDAPLSWTAVAATSGTTPNAVVNSNKSPGGKVTINF